MTRLSPHAAFWLTLVRIYLGAYWLVHGLSRLLGGAPATFPAWYHGTIAHVLLQNAHTIVPIVSALEVFAGVMLVFGLFTRFSSLLAFGLAAGFFLTKGNYTTYAGLANNSGALMMLSLLTFALAADFGVDGMRRYFRERQTVRPAERVEATPVDIAWPE